MSWRVQQPRGPVGTPTVVYPADLTQTLCRIVTVKPYEAPCPAELALSTEGLKHEVTTIGSAFDWNSHPQKYSELLTEVWCGKIGFINLEHDIVPWPGALEQMWRCSKPLCRFQYPMFDGKVMESGIGCLKIGQEVLDRVPDSWLDWHDLPWWDLDGQLLSSLHGADFREHNHFPFVAHLKTRYDV